MDHFLLYIVRAPTIFSKFSPLYLLYVLCRDSTETDIILIICLMKRETRIFNVNIISKVISIFVILACCHYITLFFYALMVFHSCFLDGDVKSCIIGLQLKIVLACFYVQP